MELTPFWFGVYKLVKYAVYPLTWLFVLLVLLTALLLAPSSPARLRWTRLLAIGSLCVLYLAANPLIANTLMALLESRFPAFDHSVTQHYDAIVVLGGGVRSAGSLRPAPELSAQSTERTLCGADLYRQGFAPRLLLSGGDARVFGEGPKEAEEMKRLAVRLGVPDKEIMLEDRSRTTYENLVETRRLLGPKSVLLVTSAMHLPRAVALARKQGLEAVPFPCGYHATNLPWDDWRQANLFDLLPDVSALRRSTEALSEMVGILVYRLTGKL